jgi:hypothetical protein
MALFQYFSGFIDESDEFADTDKNNARRLRPTTKATMCMFTDEVTNHDKRAVEYKYAFELLNNGTQVQVYDRERERTDDFMPHLLKIPKKCQNKLIESYATAFGASLGERHNFVTLTASSNTTKDKTSEPPIANLIDLDTEELTTSQAPILSTTSEQQVMKTPEIVMAFETAVTTARAPVVKRMLSAIEDKMLSEFRTKLDQLANDTMKSMLRFDQTTEDLANMALNQ